MAKKELKASDPQEKEKVLAPESTVRPEGAPEIEEKTTEETAASTVDKSDSSAPQNEEKEEKKSDYSVFDLTQLVSKLEVLTKHDNWYNHGKEIQEITYQYELKFKKEIQAKKEDFINEGGNEIDFYFRPSHKNEFDQILRDYKKKKRNYFQEREQAQKLNLDRKLEIIEGLKNLINVDENINNIYKKFRNLQDSWHKTGAVPRAQSNNIWQTYKHHTEIFYDFLHLNRELRDLDFKHNYEEKIKIIEEAEKLARTPDVLKASRDLNTLHRLWKNDLGPVAKEHREELWKRFQEASQTIHNRRQEFDKEYDNILEYNLNKKNELIKKMEEIKNNPPQNHNQWRKTIDDFNKLREEFQSIGQVTKKHSKATWNSFREISREINREKNQFYKSQKIEQRKNIDLKKALIQEVKDILEKDDWRSYSTRMKDIQKDWRNIGFIPRKFSNELWEEFRSNCNLFFERIKSGYQKISEEELEVQNKKETFIRSIKDFKIPTDIEAFKIFSDQQWDAFQQLGTLTGNNNKIFIENYNKALSEVIDSSLMEEEIKKEAKNHLRFFIIKDDDNELSREIQNIKKKIEEINSEVRQLENNLDYFSNSSSDNPLLVEVSSKLEDLKLKEQHWKDQLVPLRKMKRALESNNISTTENSAPENLDEEAN